ncbi:mechanosensitive ion channel family protein [Altererythrobacter epoxidivorans]|nr:mechanosensitive ion channel domain-containing protein [Altererythrobacter epoxidivorans]
MLAVLAIGSLTPTVAHAQSSTPSDVKQEQVETVPAIPSSRDIEKISAEEIEADPIAVATEILASPPGEYSLTRIARLTQLRSALGARRELARKYADEGSLKSRIISAQIDALGPPPVDGAFEPAAASMRRKLLDRRLSDELAPILVWRDHQIRAATLTSEIDDRIASIREDRLLSYNGTPLKPGLWGTALGAVNRTVSGFVSNVGFGQILLGILLLVLPFGLVLLGHRGLASIAKRAHEVSGNARSLIILLIEDALGLLLAVVVMAIVSGGLFLLLSGSIEEKKLASFVLTLFVAGIVLAVARWLGRSIFRSPIDTLRIVHLSDVDGKKAAKLTTALGLAVGLEAILEMVENDGLLAAEVSILSSALLVLWGSWLIWRLAEVLARRERIPPQPDPLADQTSAEVQVHEAIDFAGPISRLVKVVSLVAALSALAGFIYMAREIFFDIVATLAVVAVAFLVQRTVRLVLVVLAEGYLRRFRGIIHLLPVFTGFLIALAALPLLAIVWGYNAQEIFDGILALRNGVTLGEITISAGDVLAFAFVFFLGFVITRWLQRILRLSILPQFALDLGARSAIVTIVGYVGIVLAAIVAITSTGLDLSSLAFVAGALSVGLGFGLQSVVENFTSGVILLLERPVREGDWIEVGPYSGIVRKISVRSTRIETFDRHQIIVPNSQLITESVKNLSFAGDAARIIVPIGVSYDTDLERVRDVLLDIACNHELIIDDPKPSVAVEEFGDNSINLKLLAFVGDVTTGAGVKSELNFAIAKRFAEEGIEIPFPQRVISLRGADSIQVDTKPAGA